MLDRNTTKGLSPELHEVISSVMEIIHKIWHKFSTLDYLNHIDESSSQHKYLHAEMHWLSRGKV